MLSQVSFPYISSSSSISIIDKFDQKFFQETGFSFPGPTSHTLVTQDITPSPFKLNTASTHRLAYIRKERSLNLANYPKITLVKLFADNKTCIFFTRLFGYPQPSVPMNIHVIYNGYFFAIEMAIGKKKQEVWKVTFRK